MALQEKQISRNVTKEVELAFGFAINPTKSILAKALQVLGDTPLEFYLSNTNNLAFYDLIPGKIVLKASKAVLGLSHKFIPIPHLTMPECKIVKLLTCWECNV